MTSLSMRFPLAAPLPNPSSVAVMTHGKLMDIVALKSCLLSWDYVNHLCQPNHVIFYYLFYYVNIIYYFYMSQCINRSYQ